MLLHQGRFEIFLFVVVFNIVLLNYILCCIFNIADNSVDLDVNGKSLHVSMVPNPSHLEVKQHYFLSTFLFFLAFVLPVLNAPLLPSFGSILIVLFCFVDIFPFVCLTHFLSLAAIQSHSVQPIPLLLFYYLNDNICITSLCDGHPSYIIWK